VLLKIVFHFILYNPEQLEIIFKSNHLFKPNHFILKNVLLLIVNIKTKRIKVYQ
jgi:hypothetical protein